MRLFDELRLDLRYAVRTLARTPGFAAVVILCLALGIGANSAIFTLADAVLLRPLPVRAPGELADIYTQCASGDPYCVSSYPDFEDYRRNNRTFSEMAAFAPLRVSLSGRGAARLVDGLLVSGTYFTLLGVAPSAGRFIAPSDVTIGSPQPVAVLSHRMWTADFGGDDGIVGRALRLNGTSFTVIGVAPRGFHGTRLSYPDLWMPIASLPLLGHGWFDDTFGNRRGSRWIQGIIGRRHPGVTIEQARADLDLVALGIADRGDRGVTVEATRSVTLPATAAGDVTRFVSLLMAIVGVALLIACANIANLLLVRADARRSEIGVRMAVGAGRARLVRQLLVESVLLSAFGGVAGLVVARLMVRLLSAYALPGAIDIGALESSASIRGR